MLRNTIIVLICLFTTNLAIANSVTVVNTPPIVTKSIGKRVYTKDEVLSLIDKIATQNGVSALEMKAVIQCESQFRTTTIGDGGHSRGLVQIYDDFWPDVTHEQAFDPEFAIQFLATKLKNNQGYLWTCYRKMKSV